VTFDLTSLVDWTRRSCGDRPVSVREQIVSDGTAVITLSNDGTITLAAVSIDGTIVDITTLVVSGSIVTFPNPLTAASVVTVTYTYTTYSDDDLQEFITDAANSVQGDLPANWEVADNTITTQDVPLMNCEQSSLKMLVQRLLIAKAALNVSSDKADTAGDDAITVKDGDTTIDTSKTSAATMKSLQVKEDRYDKMLTDTRSRLFRGQAFDETRYTPNDVVRPLNMDPATFIPGDDFSPLT